MCLGAPVLIALVAAGGFAGAVLRYHLSGWVYGRMAGRAAWLPWGTLGVNVVGCFVLGLVLPALASAAPGVRTLLIGGVIGAFTTFSTLALEAFLLIEDGEYGRATAYTGLTLVAGTCALLSGMALADWLL